MQAFAVDRFGEDGSLRELPDPVAGAGELLVRVTVAGVNPVDWKIRDGAHGPRTFPLILGVDFAGVVEGVGTGVADFHAGDRIFGAARAHGSYAQITVVPASGTEQPIAKIPAGFRDEVAALLPIAGLTALATLARLDVPRGETLLVYGATGGVGAIAVQVAHARGIRVIGTARSGKEDALRKLGADEVIVYDKTDVVEAVKKAHPDGITAVIDLVNDAAGVKRLAAIVCKGGRIVSPVRSIDDIAWFEERGIAASNLAMGQTPQSSRACLEELVGMIQAGTLAVDVKAAHPLAEAGAVLAALKSGKISGNIVLNVSPGG